MMDNEIWKPVIEFPTLFKVSSNGRISSIDGTIRNLQYQKYVRFYFGVGGKWIYRKVHRLVAMAFIPNPNNLPEVNHKDFNRYNNHISNLEWTTHQGNIQHSANHGRLANKQNKFKLTIDIVTHILKRELRNQEYVRLYNLTPSVVSIIQNKKYRAYKHIRNLGSAKIAQPDHEQNEVEKQ